MLLHEVKYADAAYDPDRHTGNIDQLTLSRVPQGSRVLDIGCATGYMGHWLQTQHACSVTGVEFSAEQAEVARSRLDFVITGSAELPNIQAQIAARGPYDVVICAATIGCMVDPWALLRQIKVWLKPSGKVLIAWGNVGHWSLRRDLMRGKWDYEDFGIRDILVLRFFTVHSFRRALEQAGYRITDFDSEFYDGGFRVLLRRARLRRIERWYVRRLANFFAIQFLYEAVPA
jgi:SAM-dependent methyltransferase